MSKQLLLLSLPHLATTSFTDVKHNHSGEWKEASRQRELLLAYLQQQSGVGTLLDTRRTRDYDADSLVDKYLNLKEVQVALQQLQLTLRAPRLHST